jgi:hypothetical protein
LGYRSTGFNRCPVQPRVREGEFHDHLATVEEIRRWLATHAVAPIGAGIGVEQHIVTTRRVEADHSGQRLYLQDDHFDGIGSGDRRGGQHDRHSFSHVSHPVSCEGAANHDLVEHGWGRCDRLDPKIVGREDGDHPRKTTGVVGVNGPDFAVGLDGPHEDGMERVVGDDVGDIAACSD